MALSEARKGENEAFFRELNERLEQHALEQDTAAPSFQLVCECAVEECTARLEVPVAEYERIRDDSTRFIVARDHADPLSERVVESLSAYEIVEKFGEAGRVAQLLDPRTS